MTKFKLVTRVAFLAVAMSLAACGGNSGGVGSGVSVAPVTDSFFAAILALVSTSPDNTQPVDITAIVATSPDNTEPVAGAF